MRSIYRLVFFLMLLTACNTSKYPELKEGIYADIQTNKGDVLVKLHDKEVSMTVANFIALAEGNHPKIKESLKAKPFYENLKFHRVVDEFFIHGGDYSGTGRGKIGYQFYDEFPLKENGKLAFSHNQSGILSMANSGPNTNSSQFFITRKETPWLDNKYTVFGKVIIGQTVVDTIKVNDYIKKVAILRIGKTAKEFNAPSVFLDELKNNIPFDKKMGIDSARVTDSGLRILELKKGEGKKVNPALTTTAHYTLYTKEGIKIASSIDKGKTIIFTLNKDSLIAGWKEGVATMNEGGKTRCFIPSYLGYGSIGFKPLVKPNTDLIFEIEILKVGK